MKVIEAVRRAALLTAVLAPATATAIAAEPDAAPSSLACTFSSGSSVSYDAGAYASKTASPLAFKITKIDLEGQSAELRPNESADPVSLRIVRAVNANHFLEVLNEGFLTLTTIYDRDSKTGTHPAVHSRHLGVLGQPVFGQYTGSCTE